MQIDSVVGELSKLLMPTFSEFVIKPLPARESDSLAGEVDRLFRAASQGFPPILTYKGCALVSPAEELAQITKSGNVDVSYSTIRLLRFQLGWCGVDYSFYLHILFCKEDGTISLSGVDYSIKQVISDSSISPNPTSVYIRLTADKFPINRFPYEISVNGETIPMPIARLRVHRSRKAWQPNIPFTSCAHYLFARYGLKETFKMFGVTITLGKVGDPVDSSEVVYASSPPGIRSLATVAMENRVSIKIKKKDRREVIDHLAAAAIYTMDHVPKSYNNPNVSEAVIDDAFTWLATLGIIIGYCEPDASYHSKMDDGNNLAGYIAMAQIHFSDLATGYVSDIDRAVIAEEEGEAFADKLTVDGFWKLLAEVIENFTAWTLNSVGSASTLTGKRIVSRPYLLFPITVGINKLAFKLRQACGNGSIPGPRAFMDAVQTFLPRGAVFRTGQQQDLLITPLITTSAQELPIRTAIKPQTSGAGSMANSKAQSTPQHGANDAQLLTGEMPFVVTVMYAKKSDPNARTALNPFAHFENRVLMVKPEFLPCVAALDNAVKADPLGMAFHLDTEFGDDDFLDTEFGDDDFDD